MALVTREAVAEICTRTRKAENREPTLEELRNALGGGSDRDISRFRDEWRLADSKRAELANQPPADVQRAIDEAGRRIWAEAQRLANAMLAAAHAENEARLSQLQGDNQEILASSTSKDTYIAELAQQLEAAKNLEQAAAAEAERHRGALRKQEELAALQDDVIKHLRADVALLRTRSSGQRKQQGKG